MENMQELYTTIQDIKQGKSQKAIEKIIEFRDKVYFLNEEITKLIKIIASQKQEIEQLKKDILTLKGDISKSE